MRRINPAAFRVARRGISREINRQIALNLVRERQPISRADLARLMGVRPGGISLLVNDLLRSGLVFEGDKGESKGGRPPSPRVFAVVGAGLVITSAALSGFYTSYVERAEAQVQTQSTRARGEDRLVS